MKQFYPRTLLAIIFLGFSALSIAGSKNQLTSIFVENRGQIKDEKGATANNVLFYKAGPMQLFVTTTGFSAIVKNHTNATTTYNKIDFVFEDARIRKDQVVFVKDGKAAINLYHNSNTLTTLSGSKTVLIKNIYPGIDWLWTIDSAGNANHDFMVNIDADASVIKYHVEGAGVESTGSNIIKYSHPKFRVKEGPVVYEARDKTTPGKLVVKGNVISFEINDELKKGGFTIDPPLQLDWSYADDTGTFSGFRSICADDSLNTFTVGYSDDFSLPVFPQTNGSYSTQNPEGVDAVIMKTDWNQNLVWATFFGGVNNDEANAVVSTPSGIFVVGYSESWNFPIEPAVNGNYDSLVAVTGRDAFIAKFNSAGILRWSTGYGGRGTDEAMDIKYYNGAIYIGGYTSSHNFPLDTLPGAYNFSPDSVTKTDAFLLEFDTAGNRIWATAFGGSGYDYITSLFVDASGIYTTGYVDSVGVTPIPLQSYGSAFYQTTPNPIVSFITSFTSAGALQWSTYFGGLSDAISTCILRNNCGLYICGKTDNPGLPVLNPGSGAYYQSAFAGGVSDGFIAEFDPNTLSETYCTYYGGAGTEVLTKMASDSACDVIFTGFSNDSLPENNPNIYFFNQAAPAGGFDGLMLGLDHNLNVFWSTLFGTPGDDFGYGLQFPRTFPDIYVVDMVGEGFYNFGRDTIGATIYSDTGNCPFVTTNGESNRFYNCILDTVVGGSGTIFCIGGPFEFQSLVPLRPACPNECNGWAVMDTPNIGGCPPLQFLWSSGGQQIMDTTLCTNYWARVIDPILGESRTIYSKFDVLHVPAISAVYTDCNIVPDWDTLIHPAGGVPPYTIDFRGTSGTSCPTGALFAVTDSIGCVVSFETPWYQQNQNLMPFLEISPTCQLEADLIFSDTANCVNVNATASWQYVITAGGKTDTVLFNGNGPQVITTPIVSGYDSGYLNLGDCIVPLAGVFFYSVPQFNLLITPDCANNAGSVSVVVYPDTAALHYYGRDTIMLLVTDSTTGQVLFGPQAVLFTSDSAQIFPFPNLPGDVYHVSVFNNTCDSTVKSADLAVVQFSLNDPFINCGDSTKLIATVLHGLPPYMFSWNTGQTDSGFIYIDSPAIYTLTVTDNSHCSAARSDTVHGTLAVKIDSIAGQNSECPYNNGGHIAATVTASGGAMPYTYNWSSGEQNSTAVQLDTSFNNTVTVTDINGCSATGTYDDTIPPPMQVMDSSWMPLCYNYADGTMNVYITGGFPGPSGINYTVYWQGNGGNTGYDTVVLEPPYLVGTGDLPPDYYNYTVTDYYGCSITGSDSVKYPLVITFDLDTINCLCNGDFSGGAELTNIQSTISYNIQWSNFAFGTVDSGIPAGQYTAYLTDSNGCQYQANFYVSQPMPLMAVVDSGLGIQCHGEVATVFVTGAGGTPPYSDTGTYQLGAGSYHFYLVDSNGCSVDYTFSLSEPPVFSDNVSVTQPLCTNGYQAQVDVNATGGVPPYFIYTPDSLYQSNFYGSGSLIGVSPSEDSVITTDSHGCPIETAIVIDSNYPAQGSLSATNLLCAGINSGSITITMTAGQAPFTYNGNTFYYTYQIPNLDTGNYFLTVYDSLNCPDTFSIAITSPPLLQAYDTVLTFPLCYGDSEVVLFTGIGGVPPYTDTGLFSFSAGLFTQTIFDSNGCQASVNISVNVPDSISMGYDTLQLGCNGQQTTINVFASGGTPGYTGTGGLEVDSGQPIYVTDFNGCMDSMIVNTATPPPLADSIVIVSIPACVLGNAFVTVYISGGVSPYYLGSFPDFEDSITLEVNPNATYNYEVQDSIGCQLPIAFAVPPPSAQFMVTDSVLRQPECLVDSGEVLIIAQNGQLPYGLVLFPGDTVLFYDTISMPLQAGTYNFTIDDSFGCSTNLGFNVNATNLFSAIYLQTNPGCYGDSTGQINLSIFMGSEPYTLDSFIQGVGYVQFETLPDGDSVTVLNALAADTYYLQVTDSVGCTYDFTVPIVAPRPLLIDSNLLHQGLTCVYASDAVISITAAGGTPAYNYSIQPLPGGTPVTQSDSAFTGVAPGAYQVIVTDVNQCADTAQVVVPPFIPSTDSVVVDSATCYGTNTGVIKVYATPAYRSPYTYSLDGGAPQVFNVFYNLPAGQYQIIITDTNNCMDTLTASIGQPDSIDGRVWLNDTLLPRDTIYLNNQQFANFTKQNFDPWTVTISPALPDSSYSDTLVRVQTTQTVSYTVKVYMDSSDKGCFIEYDGVIIVEQIADMPNTITPNGDGYNDVWKIDLIKYPGADVTIFDRWGEVVYTSTNYDNTWGGIDQRNGRQLPDGTYFYILKVPSQGDMVYKGDINILDSKR